MILKFQEIIWEVQLRNAASALQTTDAHYSSTRVTVPAVQFLICAAVQLPKLFHCA